MKSTTSLATIDKLRLLFASTGIPEEVVSDNGLQFTSLEFKPFMEQNGIRHTLVPPYHPASNGFAERGVQIVKKALKAHVLEEDHKREKRTIQHRLSNFLLKYRTTPHTKTGETPSALFLKRQLRTRLSLIKPDREKFVQRKQESMKKHHDKNRTCVRYFKVGEKVLVKTKLIGGKKWKLLVKTTLIGGKKWKWIPGIILTVKGPLTYLVKVDNKVRFCHVDHLLQTHAEFPRYSELEDIDISIDHPTESNALPKSDPIQTNNNTQLPSVMSETEKNNSVVKPNPTITPIDPRPIVTPNSSKSVIKPTEERRYPQRIRKPTKRFDI